MKREWPDHLVREVDSQLARSENQDLYLAWRAARQIHLGIFVEPFLTYVLSGLKTVESRFSRNRTVPYGRVRGGDLVLMKRSGGAVVGLCQVVECWMYPLTEGTYKEIRHRFARAMCAVDADFWKARRRARYATLMAIDSVTRLEPIRTAKKDPRAWVIMNKSHEMVGLL
jgi:hypothetical protein